MEDCNPNNFATRINFTKRELIGGVILELMQYQQFPYSIKPLDDLGLILSNIPEANKDMDKKMWLESKAKEG
jgi:hypothetical protein